MLCVTDFQLGLCRHKPLPQGNGTQDANWKKYRIPFLETGSPSVAESTSLRPDKVDMGEFIFSELSTSLHSKRKRCYFVHFQ